MKTTPPRDRRLYLAAKPLRAHEAVLTKKPEGGAFLKVPLRGRWPFRMPEGATKTIELDEMGFLVWDLCDGRTSLLDIVARFAAHYRVNVREAEAATLQFIQMLAGRKLIALQIEEPA